MSLSSHSNDSSAWGAYCSCPGGQSFSLLEDAKVSEMGPPLSPPLPPSLSHLSGLSLEGLPVSFTPGLPSPANGTASLCLKTKESPSVLIFLLHSKSCRPYLHCAADLSPLPSPAPLQPLAWLPQQPRSTPQGDVVTASFRPHPLLPAHPPLDPTAEQSFLKKRSPPALASGTQHHTHSCG